MNALRPSLLLVLVSSHFWCNGGSSYSTLQPRQALHEVRNFGVQFSGTYHLPALRSYDLVIIDPDQAQHEEPDSLFATRSLAVAYVNIGEAEDYRWYRSEVRKEWLKGANPNWAGHSYLDVRNEGWQNLLLEKIIPRIFRRPYAGLFLDMVDIASPGLYPEMSDGVVDLIKRIRSAYPDKIIIMNGGAFLAGRVRDEVDALCAESVFSSYDFGSKNYFVRPAAESSERAKELRGISERNGMKILDIDYAPTGDSTVRAAVADSARRNGFVAFVGTIDLDSLPPAPVRR